jgi:hypothetical protein
VAGLLGAPPGAATLAERRATTLTVERALSRREVACVSALHGLR